MDESAGEVEVVFVVEGVEEVESEGVQVGWRGVGKSDA